MCELMDRVSRILLMGSLSIGTFLLTLYVITVVQLPVAVTMSGSDGETFTGVFVVEKSNWDVAVTYFKSWGLSWSLKVEIYREGANDCPVFSSEVVRYTFPDGSEKVELNSHPSLPVGRYYLKVYARSVQWTVQVVELK